MSTSRGNDSRKRPQKHQNRTAFKNDLHDTSQKTKMLNNLVMTGVCQRCKDVIEWKIKYKKYKTLSAPKKCVGCEQKSVKYAYHVLCNKCSKEKKVCAKCLKSNDEIQLETEKTKTYTTLDLPSLLKPLPERKRRSVMRYINKNNDGEQTLNCEVMDKIEELLHKVKECAIDDLDLSSSDDDDDDSNSDCQ